MESESIERLNDLIRVEMAAWRAYTRAIEDFGFEEARTRLVNFREDHRRHIAALECRVRAIGGSPLEAAGESAAAPSGIEPTLRGLRACEQATVHAYSEMARVGIRDWDSFHEDEQRHLRYLETALRQQPWKDPERKAG